MHALPLLLVRLTAKAATADGRASLRLTLATTRLPLAAGAVWCRMALHSTTTSRYVKGLVFLKALFPKGETRVRDAADVNWRGLAVFRAATIVVSRT